MRRLVELQRCLADLGESEDRAVAAQRVLADGELVTNAADLVDWARQPVQVLVCAHCGTSGCTGRNYVAIRRQGADYLLLPAFAAMAAGDWERDEFGPPDLLRGGACLLAPDLVARYLPELGALSALEGLEPLSAREAGLLIQWTAPHQALGQLPAAPELDPQLTFVVAAGDPEQVLAELLSLLRALLAGGDAPLWLRAREEGDEVVSCFIDAERWTEWEPLVQTPQGLRLLLGTEWVVEGSGACAGPVARDP